MSIYEKVFSSNANHFGVLAVLSFSLTLTACDKGSYDDLPTSTGNYPLTGVPPESGELLDQDIGLEGRWETYCEGRRKTIFDIKGSEVKKIKLHRYDDVICTQPSGTEQGFTYTFILKPPITTPSGLTAYPIELFVDPAYHHDKDLIVLHENTLFWQEQLSEDPNYPVDINISNDDPFSPILEFHRIE